MTDPVEMTRALIRCPSVSPGDGGALALLQAWLEPEGFECVRCDREGVPNLHARAGDQGPVLGFAGHVDVVPAGDPGLWSEAPFGAVLREGNIWGRGAVDMKSGVAAFVAAAIRCRRRRASGSVALLVTGDEEGVARHGTAAILDWMQEAGQKLDMCVVAEPTSRARVGDRVKIGRRGSVSFRISAVGKAGHSAYPVSARNPIPPLARAVSRLDDIELDRGGANFQPSTLAATGFDVGNAAPNVIPPTAQALVNIRFGDLQSLDGLAEKIRSVLDECRVEGVEFELETVSASEPFLCRSGAFVDDLCEAIAAETGTPPERSTAGGTSDARFIKDICPVIEVGLVGRHMHAIDEHVPTADVEALTRIFERIIDRTLPGP